MYERVAGTWYDFLVGLATRSPPRAAPALPTTSSLLLSSSGHIATQTPAEKTDASSCKTVCATCCCLLLLAACLLSQMSAYLDLTARPFACPIYSVYKTSMLRSNVTMTRQTEAVSSNCGFLFSWCEFCCARDLPHSSSHAHLPRPALGLIRWPVLKEASEMGCRYPSFQGP